jgi:hypothetical protein
MRKTAISEKLPVKVVGSSTFGRYAKISSELTINMFISDDWLIRTAGYQKVLDLPGFQTTGRGIFSSYRGNLLIVVAGANVYRLNAPAMIPVLVGTLASDTGDVFMDENLNSQICIVDGIHAYIYNYSNLTPAVVKQTTPGFTPNYVAYHNTFFLFGNGQTTPNGSAWYAYQYDTPTTIVVATPGQFALQTKPDYAIAVVRIPGQSSNVMVFGTTVCEIWSQVGGLQNYRRNSTLSIDYGCLSPSTIATSDKLIMWLAVNESDSTVLMIFSENGSQAVSTDGIDYQLSKIKYPQQSTAMFYRQDGHLFYQLTFYNPADNLTILYDSSTTKFFNLSDAFLNYHPAREFAFFNYKLYFVSINNAGLYQSSTDFTTYNENNLDIDTPDPTLEFEIPSLRICDTVRADDSSQFRANTFSFTLEQGQDPNVSGPELAAATVYQPAYQPRIDLTVSRDGGITWSNAVGRTLNPLGIRQNILNWDNMGMANSLTLKLRFWGLSSFVVYNGFVEVF